MNVYDFLTFIKKFLYYMFFLASGVRRDRKKKFVVPLPQIISLVSTIFILVGILARQHVSFTEFDGAYARSSSSTDCLTSNVAETMTYTVCCVC